MLTLNDLQGQMQKKVDLRVLSLVDLTNFVKNCELVWLSFENGGLGGHLGVLTEDLKDEIIFDIIDYLVDDYETVLKV